MLIFILSLYIKKRELNNEEKQTLILTVFLYDITKEEYSIDKAHPVESSSDAYYILEKLGLPETQHIAICQLIKNHDMLEQCNKGSLDSKQDVDYQFLKKNKTKKFKNMHENFSKAVLVNWQ